MSNITASLVLSLAQKGLPRAESLLRDACQWTPARDGRSAAPQLRLLRSLANLQGVEAYGLYKIGEILGRRHLIGYSVPASELSHH